MDKHKKIACVIKDNNWCVCLLGDLTRNEETELFATFPWQSANNLNKVIIFDMSHVQYLNSAGIALLIRYVREAREKEYSCCAYGVSEHYKKIFRIVGLTSYIELFQDEYSTLEMLRTRRSFVE